MLENNIKYEMISSGDESQVLRGWINTRQMRYRIVETYLANLQVHYIENASHLQYMPLNQDNFEVANAYNLKLRKKKRIRTAFTTDQVLLLENTFTERKYIDKWTRKKLAKQLKISEKNVKVWFQNRRMKNKRLSSESSDSGEVNDSESKNNESNESASWDFHFDTPLENSNYQKVESHNGLDIKNNGTEDYTPQIPYCATHEDNIYYAEQYNNAPYIPNFAFNTNYSYCYPYNNNYYYNPIDYDHSVYNFNWPQNFAS